MLPLLALPNQFRSKISMERVKKETSGYRYWSQPCFGFFLEGAVKSLAIVDAIVQFGMILCLSTGILSSLYEWADMDGDDIPRHILRFFSWGCFYVYHIVNIPYSRTLYLCADERNLKQLKRWLIISVANFIPYFGVYLMYTCWILWSHPYGAFVYGGFIVYKFYAFWVLFCYILEIKYYGGFNSALRELSDEELQGIMVGHMAIPLGEYLNVKDTPYNSNLEIPFTRIKLDERSPLGSGAFGKVLKAELLSVDGDPFVESSSITVAVKTLNTNSDPIFFKALLLELKILSYVGRHENVVNLLGACTSMLKEKKLYIVVEFCRLGCMTNYLRANRGTFIPCYKSNYDHNIPNTPLTSVSGSSSDCEPPCLTDLIKWSAQTAAGMEYISSKNIIHGDLAGRNVLLTGDKVAKIADFGLSRQLYQYSTCIKQNSDPLPWRWMSPESLCDFKFSTASDVWSLGVCMWEYFTLGETPYAGYGYSTEFIRYLRSGQIRLYKPPYAPPEIFTLMEQCWNSDPRMRPTFTEIRLKLEVVFRSSPPQIVNSALAEYICV